MCVFRSTFAVVPSSSDIGPGKTMKFTVHFSPRQEDTYFAAELEAYVYLKTTRNFRLSDSRTLSPPWCLVMNVLGTSFGTSQQFLPDVHFSAKGGMMEFAPCHVGLNITSVLMLTNKGNTPAFCK